MRQSKATQYVNDKQEGKRNSTSTFTNRECEICGKFFKAPVLSSVYRCKECKQ